MIEFDKISFDGAKLDSVSDSCVYYKLCDNNNKFNKLISIDLTKNNTTNKIKKVLYRMILENDILQVRYYIDRNEYCLYNVNSHTFYDNLDFDNTLINLGMGVIYDNTSQALIYLKSYHINYIKISLEDYTKRLNEQIYKLKVEQGVTKNKIKELNKTLNKINKYSI